MDKIFELEPTDRFLLRFSLSPGWDIEEVLDSRWVVISSLCVGLPTPVSPGFTSGSVSDNQ
ncbi:MAG: hypothetical protein P8179_12795 [Candidatus Thiodiazotropha sp.]